MPDAITGRAAVRCDVAAPAITGAKLLRNGPENVIFTGRQLETASYKVLVSGRRGVGSRRLALTHLLALSSSLPLTLPPSLSLSLTLQARRGQAARGWGDGMHASHGRGVPRS